MIDAELETAIEKAGRARVFARAEALGWPMSSSVPKWVWWGIIHELSATPPARPQAMAEGLWT